VIVRERPRGVSILAVLAILGGIFSLFLGFILLIIAATTPTPGGPFLQIFGAFLLLSSLISFVLAMGYLQGSGWAWTVGVFFGALNIVVAIVELVLGRSAVFLELIVSIVTVGYLTRPSVKEFFGKRVSFEQARAARLVGSPGAAIATSSADGACSNCGSMIPVGAGFCRNCGKIQ